MKSITVVPLFFLIVFLMGVNTVQATIVSVSADHLLTGDRGNNLFVNGSFETRSAGDPPISQGVCVSGTFGTRLVNCGSVQNHLIPGWTFIGDPGSYAFWGMFPSAGPADGVAFIYFGNGNPAPSQLPSYGTNGVVTFPDPANLTFTHPVGQNITHPTTLSQTIDGLIVGNTYLLDFFATGEGNNGNGCCDDASVFGLSISGEPLIYLTTPSINSVFGSVSERYHVTFTANATSETFEWINWGHICPGCTELILDDVILNSVPEPATFVLFGVGVVALAVIRRFRRRLGAASN